MKKYLFFMFIAVSMFLLIIKNNNSKDEIRVRVIPNSNSEYDLLVKEEVKIDVIDYINKVYNVNRSNMIDNINSSIDSFKKLLVIKYSDIDVSLENHNFYNKEYNGNVIMNECVLTLVIRIGDFNGDNWWGSIYPDLLEINSSSEVTYKSFIKELIDKWLK